MVARPVDEAPFLLGMSAPQQEDNSLAMGIDPLDDPIGKGLPPQVGVRVRHARLYRQHRIEQQHSLSGPGFRNP